MTSGIEFNRGCHSSYIILPLNKDNGMLTVRCDDKELEDKINSRHSMKNLDELRSADANGDGILSLKEIKNCSNKTEFMKQLEIAMTKFNSNPSRDYSKNLFEDWV